MNCDPVTFSVLAEQSSWVDWTAYGVLLVAVLALGWEVNKW